MTKFNHNDHNYIAKVGTSVAKWQLLSRARQQNSSKNQRQGVMEAANSTIFKITCPHKYYLGMKINYSHIRTNAYIVEQREKPKAKISIQAYIEQKIL